MVVLTRPTEETMEDLRESGSAETKITPPRARRFSTLRLSLKPDWEANLERALLKSLHSAKSEFRVRLGLSQSLKILEIDPRAVVLCILPVIESSGDSLSHVQVLLIEAYCRENSIRILKVQSPENLWNIVKHNTETDIEDEEGGFEDDEYDCDEGIVLILAAATLNTDDEVLKSVFDSASIQCGGLPIVTLPG